MKKSTRTRTETPLLAGAVLREEGAGLSVSAPAMNEDTGSRRPRAGLLPIAGSLPFLFLAACGAGGGGGGGGSSGIPGQELQKPGSNETFFVDFNQGGHATRLHFAEMFWARLVDVHDIDDQGRVNLEPIFRDFAINENIQTNEDYRVETNPITQRTRLVILRRRGAPDTGNGTFDSKLRFAAEGLPAIAPKNPDGSNGDQYPLVTRNSALVLRFDDVLDDSPEAQLD